MQNRDLSVAVCGVVFGVILGALSSQIAGPLSASVSSFVPFHSAPDAVSYTRRRVESRGLPVYDSRDKNNYPTLKEPTSEAMSSGAAVMDASSCGVVKTAIGKIRAVYDAVIPNTLRNTDIRMRMEAAFADALDDVCVADGAMSSGSMSSVSSVAAVNNHCENYDKHTVRFTQCMTYQEKGMKYPPQ